MGKRGGDSSEEAVSDKRVQTSFLARPERAALDWIAPRLPRWVGPDLLTFTGLVALGCVGVFYYLAGRNPAQRWLYLVLASLGLVVNWFGDSLDGTVARLRNRQRPMYGYYVDHLVDAFGATFVLVGLTYSGLVTRGLGVALLALYLIASINAYLATHAVGTFKISFARISPTEGRVLLIVLNTVVTFWTRIPVGQRSVLILDVLCAIALVVLLVLVLRSATLNLVRLDRMERARWADASEQDGAGNAESGPEVAPHEPSASARPDAVDRDSGHDL